MATATLDHEVEQFTKTSHQLFIDGQWVDPAWGETFKTPNPAPGESLATVAAGGPEDIDRAVRAARAAFEGGPWSRMTPSQRGRIVWRIGDLILEHLEELAQIESLDNGKPVAVARAADVPLSADMFHYMAGWATKLEGDTISLSVPYTPGAEYHTYTLREPGGGRPDHPVELPAAHGGLEAGSGPGNRQLYRAEAGGADAAVGAVAGQAHPGSGRTGRRGQRRHRIRRDRGGAAGGPRGRRQGRLHRLDRSRQAHRPGRRRQLEEGHPRARRQEPPSGVRGR